MKNVVIVGGGTGTFTLLQGLRKFPVNNAVVVSTADDGGSTGRIREDLGVLPPGDIRQCLLGLSYTEPVLRNLFSYRFENGSLSGHTVGNIILAALEKVTGDPAEAIAIAGKLLNIRGEVVPVTLIPTKLSAELADGTQIVGEHLIDEPETKRTSAIKNLSIAPAGPVNPRVIELIKQADAIVLGPGDLFTSTVPNLLIESVTEAIGKTSAKKILVANIMTKHGQTDGFDSVASVTHLERYLKTKLDVVIMNTQEPSAQLLSRYKAEHAEFIAPQIEELKKMGRTVLAENLISQQIFEKSSADTLKRSFLRHDPDKTAKLIWELIS